MVPVFDYEALNENGEKIKGSLEVESPEILAGQLRENGYFITSIREKTIKKDVRDYLWLGRVKIKDLTVFSQQLAVMLSGGLNLIESLEIVQKQTENNLLKQCIINIRKEIESGSGFAEALARYPRVFPDLYCQLIKAGELAGVLDKVLVKLAAHYQRQNDLSEKIKSALYYPLIIFCISVMVIIFLVTQVVPQFISIFSTFGGELLLPTRILMIGSKLIKNYWWVLLSGLFITGFLLMKYIKSPSGSSNFDKLILRLPVIGKIMRKIYISRFTDTTAILLNSGVDILRSLVIVKDVVGNQRYKELIDKARKEVREGMNLAQTLSGRKIFPGMVTHMIKVGEEAGTLEEVLKKIADYYNTEVETDIERAVSLIEPLMIVFLSVIVGFVVLSIVLPIFDMYSYF